MNNTASQPMDIPSAFLWYQKQQQQQLDKSLWMMQTGAVPLSDVCVTLPTFPLHLSSRNDLFSQSMTSILGEAFEPTPIRESYHRDIKNKASSTSRGEASPAADLSNSGDVLSSSGAQHSSNGSVQSSSPSYVSDASNEEREGSDAEQDFDQEFSPYQQKHWEQQYQALLKYKRVFGHCRVPHKYKADMGLARWVKRQRYQYRLRQEGDTSSTMTDYRLKKLEEVGFIWFSHASTWEQRLMELKAFREENGHCNVPSTYPPNPKLAVWVKCQRRQYKLFRRGKSSHMTQPRIEALEEINFKWEIRQGASLTGGMKFSK